MDGTTAPGDRSSIRSRWPGASPAPGCSSCLLTLLGAAIGIGVALSIPKKYQAYSELLIDPRDLKIVDRDLTQSGLPSDATLAIVENQVRVLTSRHRCSTRWSTS